MLKNKLYLLYEFNIRTSRYNVNLRVQISTQSVDMFNFTGALMDTKNLENRSVRNTKKRLNQSLIQLMEKKQITQITVKELTELADVNRGTFYFHYNDIYDMINKTEEEFFTVFEALFDRCPTNKEYSSALTKNYLEAIFTFVYENRDFCKIMLGPNGDMAFVEKMKEFVYNKCCGYWNLLNPQLEKNKYNNFNTFIINGCIGIMSGWLNGNTKESPKEIADTAAKIVSSCIKAYIVK